MSRFPLFPTKRALSPLSCEVDETTRPDSGYLPAKTSVILISHWPLQICMCQYRLAKQCYLTQTITCTIRRVEYAFSRGK